jgi:uncharacterized membrane protein YfcA
MTGVDPPVLAALCAVAFSAGCFDAIAGGGGLLTVPALLLAGLDPVTAIATNKVQGASGAVSATAAFARAGQLSWRIGAPTALGAALASVIGALSVRLLARATLDALVPLLLIAIAIYFILSPRLRDADARARMSVAAFSCTLAPAIGFYDGVFGPGAGSFYMIAYVGLLGLGVIKATAHTKLANAASNLGSLGLYAATGAIVWPVGLAMAVFSFAGAQVGSRLALRLGARLIRPMLVVISCAMALKLLSDPANPLRQAFAILFGR